MKYKYSKEKAKKILQKYNKGGGVSLPVDKTISKQEIDSFIDYVNEYYGKKGFYADQLDGGFTKAELKKAVDKYISNLDKNSTWGYGDSLDRERVRQILQPSYKLYSDGGTIIGTPETPLARGLDIDYTGLVGETGGMSAGEMFAMGGSLGNHGLKQGDQIIKTMSGGVQKVKTKNGDVVYVNLANGYRGAEPPLPFAKGGLIDYSKDGVVKAIRNLDGKLLKEVEVENKLYRYNSTYKTYNSVDDNKLLTKSKYAKGGYTNERRHVNKAQDYEVRYAKNKPNRTGYLGKRSFDDGGQLEMKFLKGGKLESKIQKKVDEVNSLIEKAIDKDGDPIMVVDKSGTWEEPMQYKPIVYKNGRLYFEYYEPYSGKTEKEVVNKSNIEFDGYPMLLDIAKMYRSALKQKGISFAGGGKTTFKEKATAIAKKFEGKKVEPKYQKEYGKTYDKAEAKEVGNKIAGSQKAKYDAKMSGGGSTKRGGAMQLAKQIRKEGESWQSALKRANEQMRKK